MMPSRQRIPRSSQKKFGDWEITERLGGGGNGEVYLAINREGKIGALKILRKVNSTSYQRFRSEIEVVRGNSDVKGLLPILDSYLPEHTTGTNPWYVMPHAQPLTQVLKNKKLPEIIESVIDVADTLTELHKRNITHRDLKPANLLQLNGAWYISDFGLVDYPDRGDLTRTGEKIGSKWTIAPEMQRDAKNADGKPADVYSLAKTLWILLTNEDKSFEGQYLPESIMGLGRYLPHQYISPLHNLLSQSTDNDPAKRLSMAEFATRLREWLKVRDDYEQYNKLQWKEAQEKLFPTAIPKRVIWEDIDDILKVLNALGSITGLNHMFLPSSGGLDLRQSVLSSTEGGCIELHTDGTARIVKPKRLIFESFGVSAEWNYFRLETGYLERRIGYKKQRYPNQEYEEVLELMPGEYVERRYWEENEYDGHPLPSTARPVIRHFRGDFVIFQKTSSYNMDPSTYDARHNHMATDEFREYIERSIASSKIIKEEESEDKSFEYTQEIPGTKPSIKIHLPRWLSSILVAGLFLLVHVIAPWGLSLLSTRYGWVGGRPGIWNLLALIVVGAGIACTLWLISLHFRASPESFVELRPIQKLLTPGPYTFSRNPMYLSELVFWFGWALFYGSLAVFIGFLFWGVLFNFVIVPWEERDLEARFGEAYREYKARVPRWIGLSRR